MDRRSFLVSGGVTAVSCSGVVPAAAETPASGASDPLLADWTGPHGGVPPFQRIHVQQFKPALTRALDLARRDVKAIAGNPRPPTFENTIARLEDSGRPLSRAKTLFNVYGGSLNDDAMRAVQAEMTPLLAAFDDEITQNSALFARVRVVYEQRERTGLTAEQQRLTWVIYNRFARQGAGLGTAEKARLTQINQALAGHYTTFSQNQLADEESQSLVLQQVADLAGLPDGLIAAAARAAVAQDKGGQWLLANTRSAIEPFLTYSARRDLRERAWRMWTSRGDSDGQRDNKPVITAILDLRMERAQLLGFDSHAHWILADNMAKTPDTALALMLHVWRPAVARVRQEVADMQKFADADQVTIAPWDYRYYAEKVRKATYDFDENEVKPYLQLDKMREAMFWVAGELYGFRFTRLSGIPVFHPDVVVYEVRGASGRVGLWYFDPYARAGKRSGAWMDAWRPQERFRTPLTAIVSNNANFVRGETGKPVLISWEDAVTLFHEFGHALHGLNSSVRYPTLASPNTAGDFVEFPSQINEHWLPTREVLGRFALHYQTGAPMPAALLEKIQRARTFNQGFKTVEYLACALYDMRIHMAKAWNIDPARFEREVLAELGMPAEIVMRHRPPHFGHIFSGDEYSAGYYGYIWADTLTADAFNVFTEGGGPYDKAVARRFRDDILAVGNTVDPAAAFARFRGRDVDVSALMADRGFPADGEKSADGPRP